MTLQHLQKFLPFVLAQRTACRSITTLLLLALMVMGLPTLSDAQQTCRPDGDVDQNGSVTAADALLAFQQALSLVDLNTCQLSIADVFPQPAAPDDAITASDALCIFQKALSIPSCLDTLPPQEVMVSLYGIVVDQSSPIVIPGATIRVTQYSDGVSQDVDTITTDDGHYEIQVDAALGRVSISAEAEDYAPQSVIVNLVEGQTSAAANLAMVPIPDDGFHTFRSTVDTEVRNEDHVLVSVAANSLATEDGDEPAGEITAMVTVLDASSDPGVMPGDFVSRNADSGELEPIESFGAINIMFEDENGEPLNLSSGQEATISIPLASAKSPADAPAMLPMFYWSDEKGYWIEQGNAALEEVEPGKWAYVGVASHFSTWSVGRFWVAIQISGCVEDREGNLGAFARVTVTGVDYIGETSTTADTNGDFTIVARQNSEVTLAVLEDQLGNPRSLATGSVSITLDECLLIDYSITIDPVAPVAQAPLDYGVGTSWTVVDTTTNGQPETLTVVEIGQFNGREAYRLEISPPAAISGNPCDGANGHWIDAATHGWMACIKNGQILGNAYPYLRDIAWPLKVGNRWRARYLWMQQGEELWEEYTVFAYEEVTVPAGTIMAYRIGLTGSVYSGYYTELWYAPEVRWVVKRSQRYVGDSPEVSYAFVSELVSYEIK